MLINIYKTTRRHTSENRNLHILRRENVEFKNISLNNLDFRNISNEIYRS